jgi:predicted nicotinamide N-methyase
MPDGRQRLAAPEFLRSRFELASTEVVIGGQRYELLRPGNIDDLISEEEFSIDDRIPYWAECWPSSRVLAERLTAERGAGRTLLELGCGIGLVSIAAAQAGFEVLATDYYADALEFASANAERHGITDLGGSCRMTWARSTWWWHRTCFMSANSRRWWHASSPRPCAQADGV